MNSPFTRSGLLLCLLAPASFLVGEEIVVTSSVTLPIPDDSGGSSAMVLFQVPPSANPLTTVSVSLELQIEHPWVGDLRASLLGGDGSTEVVLFERPGRVSAGFPGPFGCGGDDVDAVFRDDSTAPVDLQCSVTARPVLSGALQPVDPLTAFTSLDPVGSWLLTLTDLQSGDAGQLVEATLILEVQPDCDQDGLPDDCACTGDLDDSGVIDGADLSTLLSQWNEAGTADLDRDGFVGGADLAILISSWGLCR